MIVLMCVLRTAAGAVLVAAGVGKLVAGPGMAMAPMVLPSLSGPWFVVAGVIEGALPAIEVIVGTALAFAIGRRLRNAVACLVAGAFAAVSAMIPEGVRCGCFGILGSFADRGAHRAAAAGLLLVVALVTVLETIVVARRKHKEGNDLE